MRHAQDGYYNDLLGAWPTTAIVNAGDGAGQHPSQMMLESDDDSRRIRSF